MTTAAGGRLRAQLDRPVVGTVLAALAGYVLLVEVGIQLVFGRLAVPFTDVTVGLQSQAIPRGLFLVGAVIGSLYALVAVGLILVYRANRIINFAQAQLGAVPAVAGLLLLSAKGWSYWLVLPLVLVGGALTGGLVEVGIVRRFKRSSRLILTVATVGIGFLLLVLEFVVKEALVGGDLLQHVADFPTPLQSFSFSVGGTVTLFGDHLLALVTAFGAVVALTLFFRRTRIGIAVRAAASNRDRAALLGIPVDRVTTVVWVLAGTLSAIGVFLRAPLHGLPLGGFVGPLFLLYGLTAAVIARMERLSTAVLAGLFVGIADVSSVFATNRSSLATALMVGVILVALLVQRRGEVGRAVSESVASWRSTHELRPIPLELRDLPEVRLGRGAVIGLVVLAAAAMPWILGDLNIGFATTTVIYAMVGVSLVILTGWAGDISLGQFAISGIGAAVAGGLLANHGADFFASLIAAGLAGALVAVLIGVPALRMRGLYLAVTTLAFSFTVAHLVLDPSYFGWLLPGDRGFVERPVLWGRIDLAADGELLGVTVTADAKLYLLCLGVLVLVLGMAHSLRRYRSGRVLIGMRDSADTMQAFGISPAATRLSAFALSGFVAALAGALFVITQGSVDAQSFLPEQSIQLFVMTVIGGITSLTGALLGAVFLQALPVLGLEELPFIGPVVEILGTGLGILLILAFLPGGLAEGLFRLRDGLLRRIAGRRGIVVPSLLADRGEDAAGPDAGDQDDVAALLDGVEERRLTVPGDGDDQPAEAPEPAAAGGGG